MLPKALFLKIHHAVVNIELHNAEQNIFFLALWCDILVALKESPEFSFPSTLKKKKTKKQKETI